MSPQELTEAALRKLLSELETDRESLARIAGRIAAAPGRRGDDSEGAAKAYLAVELHRYYTALETLLERALRVFDQELPAGPGSHRELLALASRELPGVRPGVLDQETYGELTHLFSFRHFFRHAYAVELDALSPDLKARLAPVARWERLRRALPPREVWSAWRDASLAPLLEESLLVEAARP